MHLGTFFGYIGGPTFEKRPVESATHREENGICSAGYSARSPFSVEMLCLSPRRSLKMRKLLLLFLGSRGL